MTSKDYYFDSYAHFGIHEVGVVKAIPGIWLKNIFEGLFPQVNITAMRIQVLTTALQCLKT
jgi:hypothetical protein